MSKLPKEDFEKDQGGLSWKEKLSALKETLPVHQSELRAIASSKAKQVKKKNSIRRSLLVNLSEAAARLDVSQDKIRHELRRMDLALPQPGERLALDVYIFLIRRFDPARYQRQKETLEEIIGALPKWEQGRRRKTTGAEPVKKQPQTARFTPLPTQQSEKQQLQVAWSEIIFEDYHIKVRFGDHFSKPYPLLHARKSLKLIKKYIASLQLDPLIVHLNGREITHIENAEELQQIVLVLQVRQLFIEQAQKGKPADAAQVLKAMESLSTDILDKLAKSVADEPGYLDYLSDLQHVDYKPVPAFEVIASAGQMHTEDTFIFTLQGRSSLLLVWESTLRGRATYVFMTDESTYTQSLQIIFDYIASQQRAKRSTIRSRQLDFQGPHFLTYITHAAFDLWAARLGMLLKAQDINNQR